jgi:RHH-type proline utilization regulon transcriptional repressor/proline dehydrogenase/delta 1-pyrroline-5-carboxylate dehydrogenase
MTAPFAAFAPALSTATPLRQRISAACRTPEPEAVAALLPLAEMPAGLRANAAATAQICP